MWADGSLQKEIQWPKTREICAQFAMLPWYSLGELWKVRESSLQGCCMHKNRPTWAHLDDNTQHRRSWQTLVRRLKAKVNKSLISTDFCITVIPRSGERLIQSRTMKWRQKRDLNTFTFHTFALIALTKSDEWIFSVGIVKYCTLFIYGRDRTEGHSEAVRRWWWYTPGSKTNV